MQLLKVYLSKTYLDKDERFQEQRSLWIEQPAPAYVPHSDIETYTLQYRSAIHLEWRQGAIIPS